MKNIILILITCFILAACSAQEHQEKKKISAGAVGSPCEGCQAVYEWGDKPLQAVDTLPDFEEQGPWLKITGTIYKSDGKTPAEAVILYIYHTNQQGVYPVKGGEKGWAKRHGYLRGWVKTKADGKYTFYTLRPGIYPDCSSPAHIHATEKEPGIQAYYLDDYEFDDDPFVDTGSVEALPRGGSGLLSLQKEGDIWTAERDIILGLNIPNYEK